MEVKARVPFGHRRRYNVTVYTLSVFLSVKVCWQYSILRNLSQNRNQQGNERKVPQQQQHKQTSLFRRMLLLLKLPRYMSTLRRCEHVCKRFY